MRDGAVTEFDAFPPSLCYGATSLPAISSKTFTRLLPPSGIRRGEQENYETFHATQIIRKTMNVFLVYAHAEPQSFNGALFQTAQDTLRDAGHAGGFESRFQTGGR
jgi:hypothetical protein